MLPPKKNNQILVTILLMIWVICAPGCKKIEPERIFKVETSDINEIDITTWSVTGSVIDLGNKTIHQHGFCWSTNPFPVIDNCLNINSLGSISSISDFSSNLADLEPETTYYVRAYLTNSDSVTYGRVLNFTTGKAQNITLPQVATSSATDVSQTSAIVGGIVTNDGGATVTERGIFYGTSSDPQTTGIKVSIGNGTGSFSTTLSGLLEGVKYYFVAYAINSKGTGYGTTLDFTTKTIVVLPTVSTTAASSISQTSAVVGGEVTDNGGANVTERGIFYGTSSDPQTTGIKLSIGNGTGSFSTTLTGLLEGVKYYFVAYAINSKGTGYGTTLDFTTNTTVVQPTVSTTAASSISQTSAVVGGEVTDNGGATVTERGVYYGTSSDPATTGTKVNIGEGVGTFSTTISGLKPATKYYFVAFATNNAGTSYGTELDFTTSQETVVDYDGNVYQTVVIGTQTWMVENLKATNYHDGGSIPSVTGSSEWRALGYTDEAYCYYDNNPAYADIYGALYNWAAVMHKAGSSSSNPSGVQGVCPDGWHIPSDDEWKQMEMYLGMSQSEANSTDLRGTNEGGQLKEEGFAHWNNPNTGATNASGFTALGSGTRDYFGEIFWNIKGEGFFWTTTQTNSDYSYSRGLYNDSEKIGRYSSIKGNGFSVRCIKD